MSVALFAFNDRAEAARIVDRLKAEGLPEDALRLHVETPKSNDDFAADVDELVTGGLLGNVSRLFGQLLDWGSSPIDPGPYAEVVRQGGAVVRIDAADDAGRTAADRVTADANCVRRSGWSDATPS